MPDVGFDFINLSQETKLIAKVEAKIVYKGTDHGLVESKYYSGVTFWEINPKKGINGHFKIPKEFIEDPQDLKIEVRITIIDQYERHHRESPHSWSFSPDPYEWVFEPRAFTHWD
ncbi:MAG: hypothetical protein ACFFCF_11775 [Promethearchaeota archaeon]